jgi:prepilin-type N-terminal cleavage/methylation domain-containing protein
MSSIRNRIHRRVRATADGDGGFTLLEVIVSFVLFAIVAAGATTGIVAALNASHSSQQRVDASNLGQQDLALALAAYRSGTMPQASTYTSGVTNEQFTITRTVTLTGGATACAPGGSFTVHVEVRQKQTTTFLAQTDTVIAC